MNSSTLLALLVAASTLMPLDILDRRREEKKKAKEETARKEDLTKKDEKARRDDRDRLRKDDKTKADDPPAGAFEIETIRNIAYRTDKEADPVKHKLDLYLPRGERDFPVVFFVHGGGWNSGNKELYAALGQSMARNGIGAVLINYRLTPKVKFPTHVEDVAKAFAWTYANIARYGGRTDRIILFGHSAGGHLVSLLATDEKYLKSENRSFADIRAVVTISGVYAVDEIYGLYTGVFGRDREDRRDASPRHHVRANHPPFLILYADKDLPTIEKVSEEFFNDLRKAKCDVRAQKISNRTHISIILLAGKDDDSAAMAVFDFIERQTEWRRPAAGKEGGKP